MPACKQKTKSCKAIRKKTTRKHRGGSFLGWLKKANTFLRKHKVLSSVGSVFAPLHPKIAAVNSAAKALGYGKRVRFNGRRGGGFRLAGGRLR